MKNKIIIFSIFIFISVFGVTILPSQVLGASCAPGYIQGNVPTTQVPDYSYTSDGFLELHFRLTDANWKYNYGRIITYYSNCDEVGGGEELWKIPVQTSGWPGVNHLVLRFAQDDPLYPNYYHFNAYNGDTGEPITLVHDTILSQFSRSYYQPAFDSAIRIVLGNKSAGEYVPFTEPGGGDLISTLALPVRITPYVGKTPVLIVPGLMGTEMKKSTDTLWINSAMVNPFNNDSFMDPLQFSNNLSPSDNQVVPTDVIKSIKANIGGVNFTLYNYAEDLINEFTSQGYVDGQTLFTFPYDWRYGVSGKYADGKTNTDLLAQKIQAIMQQTGGSKVDVVAHSLGGLIVKEYAMNHPTDNHIGKAVFVGVPNAGAPKAVKVLLQGDNMGVLGLNDQEMKKIAANMPSAYDLLPSQQYYNVAGSFVSQVDIGSGLGISEPTEKDLNYSEFGSYLNNKGLNSTAFTNSTNLHTTAFDNFDLRTSGVDLYAIDGCKAATMTNVLEVIYKDALGGQHTEYDNVKLKAGDNTVPLDSATNLPINQNNKYYALVSDHGKMPSQDGIRQEIVNLISGSNLDTGNNLITQDVSKCQLNGKAISVFSPVNIFVTDQNGNRIGLADDGSVINEIPNADFEIMGEHKFLYLPQDEGQTYAINMQGTGTGTYTIKSQDISNSQVVKAEVFSDLPVTPALTGQIIINPTNDATTLSVNSSPTPILPTKVLDFSQDKTAPEAVMHFNPSIKDLSFSGTDNLSDIFSISLVDAGNSVILTDEAGNTTELDFKERSRRTAMSAEMTSIKYNGVPISIGSNLFSCSWSVDKLGNLSKLTQKVKARNNYSITAIYDGVNTKLTGTTSAGKISQSFSGLKILKITTSKGDLSWSY